jgi:hypothetical protein
MVIRKAATDEAESSNTTTNRSHLLAKRPGSVKTPAQLSKPSERLENTFP